MYVYYDIVILTQKSLYFLHNGYTSSCERKLNGYINLKRTVGYQSTKIGKFACYILACLSSCLITEWLQLPHEATSSCHRVCVYCTVSCFAGRYVYVYAQYPQTRYVPHIKAFITHCNGSSSQVSLFFQFISELHEMLGKTAYFLARNFWAAILKESMHHLTSDIIEDLCI